MKFLSTYSKYTLFTSFAILLALLIVVSGTEEISAHCCKPTATPTFTPSPTPTFTVTPTPTPTIRECQVVGIIFSQESYFTNQTIEVTVRLADHAGTPLVGANVAAEVTRQPLSAQASTGFGLVDRAGEYDGTYTNTELAGIYTFDFTATDVSGERFLPCTGSATVLVDEPADTPTPEITNTPTATPTDTPSPTPTNTNTPTPTPTFTPTPPPAVNTLPQTLETTLCSLQDTIAIRVDNVVDLAVVEMEVTYDPAIIQVIDADASQRGVQVRVDESFSTDTIFRNEVDTSRGRISFGAGVIGVPAINGSSGIIAVDWRPQRVGSSAVTIESISLSDVNGQPISAAVQGGTVEVQFVPNCLSGTVALQGRSKYGGVLVTNGNGDRTVTQADGSFSISESDTLSFEFPAFVAAKVNLQQTLAAKQNDQSVQMESITLLAGDINGDNTVDILDLAYLATKYQTADPLADLNADGTVSILDLALLAGNFQQQGPVVSSQ